LIPAAALPAPAISPGIISSRRLAPARLRISGGIRLAVSARFGLLVSSGVRLTVAACLSLLIPSRVWLTVVARPVRALTTIAILTAIPILISLR